MTQKKEVKKKILVIEDEQDLREALETSLSYEAFEVLTAEDGEEGLALALKEKPDLIILDLGMPKMDGIAVIKNIREEEGWGKWVHILILTALDDMEKIAEVLEQGGDEYLLKAEITLGKIVEKVKAKLNT